MQRITTPIGKYPVVINGQTKHLTILKEIENPELRRKGRTRVDVKCHCGRTFNTAFKNIKWGHTKSCGCYKKQALSVRASTHGLSKHPLYRIFANVRARCYNNNDQAYQNYGGRGITVCDEWLNDYAIFIRWALANGWKAGLEIDRINNDGNYEPCNCQFVTPKINCRNRRSNVIHLYNGESKTLPEWCEVLKLNYSTIKKRIQSYGWSVEKAFTTPVEVRVCV